MNAYVECIHVFPLFFGNTHFSETREKQESLYQQQCLMCSINGPQKQHDERESLIKALVHHALLINLNNYTFGMSNKQITLLYHCDFYLEHQTDTVNSSPEVTVGQMDSVLEVKKVIIM